MKKPTTFREASNYAEARGYSITETGRGKEHCYMVWCKSDSRYIAGCMTVAGLCHKLPLLVG